MKPFHQIDCKHVVEKVESGEEKHKRRIYRCQKPDGCHCKTQNQHGFSCCHVGIGLRLRLRGLFFHNQSIQPQRADVNIDMKNASVLPKHMYVESVDESQSKNTDILF